MVWIVAAVFWLLLLSINLIRAIPFLEGEALDYHLQTVAITFSLDLITFSVFYFWLIPLMIRKRNSVLTLIGILYWGLFGFAWGWVYNWAGRIDSVDGFFMIYKSSIGHTILHTLYALVLFLSVDWYYRHLQQKRLEEENVKMRLSMLKSQVNPHFLFNVLNNIHSLVHRNPDKTGASLIRLSEIMRYMLYESDQEKVPLNKEIEHINHYLELQRLRLVDQDTFKLEVEGNTDKVSIAPLIFISFVENAFKHGKKNFEDAIYLYIGVSNDQLLFKCENYLRDLSESEKESSGEIGLDNIKKRLALLYPEKHQLRVGKVEEQFKVELIIDLD